MHWALFRVLLEAEGPLQQWRGRCQGRGQGDCADDIPDEMNSRPNPWSYKGGVEFERVVAQEITYSSMLLSWKTWGLLGNKVGQSQTEKFCITWWETCTLFWVLSRGLPWLPCRKRTGMEAEIVTMASVQMRDNECQDSRVSLALFGWNIFKAICLPWH